MNERANFKTVYKDRTVECLEFERFDEHDPRAVDSASFRLMINKDGFRIWTGRPDSTGAVLWMPDDTLFTNFREAAHEVFDRYHMQDCFISADGDDYEDCAALMFLLDFDTVYKIPRPLRWILAQPIHFVLAMRNLLIRLFRKQQDDFDL